MWNARLEESQDGMNITGKNMNNFRYAYDTTLMAENWSVAKEPLDQNETGEWKIGLKTQHWKNEDHGI